MPPINPSALVSTTRTPTVLLNGKIVFRTDQPRIITMRSDELFAATIVEEPEGSADKDAGTQEDNSRTIGIGDYWGADIGQAAQWGWSVWGGRKITNLRWSPDGKYVAYSVSKRPFEDELFYVEVATGKCWQLPVRTGSAAWDWCSAPPNLGAGGPH